MIDPFTGPPDLETGSRLTIDLGALQSNWKHLASCAGEAECAAVVKADAYGIGIRPAVRALWQAGARTFFVALPFEARAVREELPDAAIYVLGGLAPGSSPILAEIKAHPVLGSLPEIDEWELFAKENGIAGEAAIHVDTGMNRLGLSFAETQDVAKRYAGGNLAFRPSLIMSHLACGEDADHPLTEHQIESFGNVAADFPGVPASLANSAGTLQGGAFVFDLCRPGIALYGGHPLGGDNPLKPVVLFDARVIQVREVDEGETVGYGATETARRPSRVAVVSAGYADGFMRAAGSSDDRRGADAIVAGKRCPLIGRVSMDLIAVDVTDLAPDAVRRGDFVTLIGDGITIDEVGARANTIGYEILTGLGSRFARIYIG
ncbi:alanine racemase [Flaviflagellibacter deserti]|uniref:Alanine racemase n=1 Tax=Flaviflagellibacter deserti TaxID=2267266 RepID=A0ABV9Z3H8_9HYPH